MTSKRVPVASVAFALVLAAALAGCGGATTPSTPAKTRSRTSTATADFSVPDLVSAFKKAGLPAKAGTEDGGLFGAYGRGSSISVASETVDVYTFPTPAAAARVADEVSPDGTSITTFTAKGQQSGFKQVDFVGPVHHFRKDALIVVYIERTRTVSDVRTQAAAAILDVLRRTMGAQLAGQR